MALGVNYESSVGGGDFLPVVKYNAKAGRWSRVDRENGVSEEIDITRSFKAVFDFENIEVGHISFVAGQAPDFSMVPFGDRIPPAPTSNHKNGVRLLIKLSPDCGGDVRELASVAKAFLGGIDRLHDDYEAGSMQNPGKLPVVVMSDTLPITSEGKGQKSTNYAPVFTIEKWVSRPADLVASPRGPSTAKAEAPARATPPSTGSTRASAPFSNDDDDFG